MMWFILALLVAAPPSTSTRALDFPVRIEVASKDAFVVITDEMTDPAEDASGFVPVMHRSEDGALQPGIPVSNDTGVASAALPLPIPARVWYGASAGICQCRVALPANRVLP